MFAQFMDYVTLADGGKLWQDQVYKNYDLSYMANPRRLKRALADCGFVGDRPSMSLAECVTRVHEWGFTSWSEDAVRKALMDWYVWRRLNAGEFRTWKYRAKN